MTDLLNCPFCGGEAEIWRAQQGRTAWIGCMGRCSVSVSKEYKTDAEAITAWNTRAQAPAAPQVSVKVLFWEENPDKGECGLLAHSVIGTYHATCDGWSIHRTMRWEDADTIDAAKAAAQADYEARIVSAIDTTPVSLMDFSGNINTLMAMASNFDRTKETANAEFCRKAARDFAAL